MGIPVLAAAFVEATSEEQTAPQAASHPRRPVSALTGQFHTVPVWRICSVHSTSFDVPSAPSAPRSLTSHVNGEGRFERTIFTTAPGDLVAALLPAGRGACMTRPPAPKPWSWCGLGAAIFAPMNGAPLMRCLVGRRIQGPGVWVVEAIWLILEVVRHCRCLDNVWGFALWRQPRWRLKRF